MFMIDVLDECEMMSGVYFGGPEELANKPSSTTAGTFERKSIS